MSPADFIRLINGTVIDILKSVDPDLSPEPTEECENHCPRNEDPNATCVDCLCGRDLS